jgi:hypothetical protein
MLRTASHDAIESRYASVTHREILANNRPTAVTYPRYMTAAVSELLLDLGGGRWSCPDPCELQIEPAGAVSQPVHVGNAGLVEHGGKLP